RRCGVQHVRSAARRRRSALCGDVRQNRTPSARPRRPWRFSHRGSDARMLRKLTARGERWPLSRPFRISRGVKTQADVVTVEIAADGAVGMGEATPYGRYGETT